MDGYFQAYEDLKVHSLMLNDDARLRAYKEAITNSMDYIKGKVVLDVGAGTGILSVFCAQAGAAKVYAVEAAAGMIPILEEVIHENEVNDVVKVYCGAIEDVTIPEKVDVLVSEFMGFYLFHEGMLSSVIYARDKYLKDGGLMLPSECHLFMAPCEVPDFYEQWDSVHGVKMSSFAKSLRNSSQHKPSIHFVHPSRILATPNVVFSCSLSVVTDEDVDQIVKEGLFVAGRDGNCQGITIWFDVTFSSGVVLSTSPFTLQTHWLQTVLILPTQVEVEENEPLAYRLEIVREGPRKYTIQYTCLDPSSVIHPCPCKCNLLRCAIVSEYLHSNPSPEDSFSN